MRDVGNEIARRHGINLGAPRGRSPKDVKPHAAASMPRAGAAIDTFIPHDRLSRDVAHMNGAERAFAAALETLHRVGAIRWWTFEGVRFRIARAKRSAFYTPDFVVVDAKGTVIAYEVKGHWEEAAKVRVKVAADRVPWVRFVVVRVERRKGADPIFHEEVLNE